MKKILYGTLSFLMILIGIIITIPGLIAFLFGNYKGSLVSEIIARIILLIFVAGVDYGCYFVAKRLWNLAGVKKP